MLIRHLLLTISTMIWLFAGVGFANGGPWILLDANNGKIFGQYQATRPWHPASLTKLMTIYTVFREIRSGRISFLSPVRVSAFALSMPPSKMGLPIGTIMNFDNALKMLMVKSANDISVAVAQSAKGSLEAFVEQMNKNAKLLGMDRTHFTNPHGLHELAQVTSARDMALLALALQNEFAQYSHYFNIASIKLGKVRMKNHNKLMFKFKGTNGFKTGYTCASGLNIVARAKRGSKQFIAVVLGGHSGAQRNILTGQLLHAAFNDNYNWEGRPHIKALKTLPRQYNVPGNLLPMVCQPNWQERKLTRKQRRKARKVHLAKLKVLQDAVLGARVGAQAPTEIFLGGAFGPNPFKLKVDNGGTPTPVIGTPVWRPDLTLPPN